MLISFHSANLLERNLLIHGPFGVEPPTVFFYSNAKFKILKVSLCINKPELKAIMHPNNQMNFCKSINFL